MEKARQRWGTRLGVILAVAGSAVGLGNFLRFPVQAAKNGGGAFMIPYLVALVLIGIPLVWAEWTAGRFGGGFGHTSAPGIFQSMWKKSRFIKYLGIFGIFGPFLIYMYYVYIESWCLAYAYYSLTGQLASITSGGGFIEFLSGYQGITETGVFSGTLPGFVFFLITFLLNMSVTYFGIKGGIEKLCNIALPLLFFFGIVLAVRVITLFAPDPLHPDWSSINGLGFLWNPDFSALKSAKVWLAAAGQIFFTLSVGMGVILTYSSYLRKNDDVALSGLAAASTNEFAEVIIGGSLVIPAAFIFFGPEEIITVAESGAFNLGFVTMPQIFNQIPVGALFGFLWFFMLFLAGITSSISIAQPSVAFLEDELKIKRQSAVKIFGVVAFLLCQPAIWFMHRGVLGDLDFWGANFIIVLGATIEIILLAWIFGIDKAWHELHQGADLRVPRVFRFIIKYITPTCLLTILIWWLISDWWDTITMKEVASVDVPYILGTRLLLLALLGVLAIMVRVAWHRRKLTNAAEEAES
ncbi:MAG: sodium-dependent transporter [candidate division Zixibacteria bacterium]|nr:sodium-dependent transporter [candidate division Zixibacteria bacterium]